MSFWSKLFGVRESPEETLRLTRRVMDLMQQGMGDDEIERVLYREGAGVDRAHRIVKQVRELRDLTRGR